MVDAGVGRDGGSSGGESASADPFSSVPSDATLEVVRVFDFAVGHAAISWARSLGFEPLPAQTRRRWVLPNAGLIAERVVTDGTTEASSSLVVGGSDQVALWELLGWDD